MDPGTDPEVHGPEALVSIPRRRDHRGAEPPLHGPEPVTPLAFWINIRLSEPEERKQLPDAFLREPRGGCGRALQGSVSWQQGTPEMLEASTAFPFLPICISLQQVHSGKAVISIIQVNHPLVFCVEGHLTRAQRSRGSSPAQKQAGNKPWEPWAETESF